MPKTKLSSRIKIALLRIMEAMGTTASHWASNAKLRVQEINLEARRHEILTESSLRAFELWHNRVKLPKELSDMFTELSEIDDKLSILRAQKYAKVKMEGESADMDGAEVLHTGEAPAEPVACTPAVEAEPSAEEAEAPKPVRKAPVAAADKKATPRKIKKTPLSVKRQEKAKPKA